MIVCNKAFLLAITLVLAAVLAAPVFGQVNTWNYSTDFSTTANPSGAWHYGSYDGSYTAFTPATWAFTGTLGTDYAFWVDEPAGNPCCGKVLGTIALEYPAGTGYPGTYLPPGGYMGSPNNANKPVARWVSPIGGRVRVTATFKGGIWTGTGSNSDVLILKNGNAASPLFSGHVSGFPGGGSHPAIGTGHTASYSGEVVVSVGDTIDFAASNPGNRNFDRDQLAFSANIEALDLPEPRTLTGAVTDQATGAPIEGALIGVVGTSVQAVTNGLGVYTLRIIPGTYSLDVSATLYEPRTAAGVVVTTGGGVCNFSLVKVTQWSLAGDWSRTQNPNPPWTYGRYSVSVGTFYPHTLPVAYYGVDLWRHTDEQYTLTGGSFGSDLDLDGVFYPLGTVTFIPGHGLERSGARWTAPYAATVRVSSIWSGRYHGGPVNADLRILRNACVTGAVTLLHDGINGFAGGGGLPATGTKPVFVWTGVVTVAKNDTIDFMAGVPTGGTRLDGIAGLAAGISTVGSEASAARLSELKGLADGQFVIMTEPKVVTVGSGTFADGTCYVANADRVSAVKIVLRSGLAGVAVGERIVIQGILAADPNGERTIYVTDITSRESGGPIGPLGAPNKTIKIPVT